MAPPMRADGVGKRSELFGFAQFTANSSDPFWLPDLAGSPVRRSLPPRFHHAARLALAALDPGGGGDEGGAGRRGLEKLLHAGAEALEREDRAGGNGPKIGGDLLEAAATLATRATSADGRVAEQDELRCARRSARSNPSGVMARSLACAASLIGCPCR